MSAQAQPRSDVEVEWQLDALDLRPVERWLAARTGPGAAQVLPGLGIVPGVAKRLVDSYVDTEDWRIGQAGYVLRVRRRSGRLETTLKDLAAADKGLRRRLEVTQPLPAAGLEALDRTGEVGWRVGALSGTRPLRQVLEVRTRRRPFNLEMHGERVGELALDDTVIAIGQERRRLRLTRVEVEVLPAWVEAMQPLVEQLRRECGLQPATLSKFEAGLMAAGLAIPGPPELGPTDVTPECSLGELAYRVLRRDALAMLAQVPGTRLGEDVEALHQMRVATRRMRAGLDMFAEVLPVRARHLHAELGWLAGLLGEVRDLDVQIGRFEEWNEEMTGEHREALDELAELLVAQRGRARAALLEAFDSKRYERLVSGLLSTLSQTPSSRFSAARTAAVVAMPGIVVERQRAAAKAARRATHSGAATDYHRLRIRCKRLRYSLEFAAGLYDGELKAFVRQMARLQDTLGAMQDAEVASSRLEAIALTDEGVALSRATIFAMGGVAGRYHNEAEHLLSQLPDLVGLLAGREWRRATGMMELRRRQALEPAPGRPGVQQGARIVQGRARPAIAKLAPGTPAPHLPPAAPEEAGATAAPAPGEEAGGGHPEPVPGEAQAATAPVTPILRQVAPS
jgi:CHAD domain-containing protein